MGSVPLFSAISSCLLNRKRMKKKKKLNNLQAEKPCIPEILNLTSSFALNLSFLPCRWRRYRKFAMLDS